MLYIAFLGIPMSVLLCHFALSITEKKKVSLLSPHLYHRVKKQNLPAYTERMGEGLCCIGVGLFITSFCALFFDSLFIWLAFLFGLLVGFSAMNDAQREYNAGWY